MSSFIPFSALRSCGAAGRTLSSQQRCETDRKTNRPALRTRAAWLAACTLVFAGVSQATAGAPTCRPVLNIKDVKFSPMTPPTMERKWSATVAVDASRCATTAGYFEIGFLREKENGMALEFREQFIWSAPSVLIGLDFWADEAVERAWIGSIQACPCAR